MEAGEAWSSPLCRVNQRMPKTAPTPRRGDSPLDDGIRFVNQDSQAPRGIGARLVHLT
jgi:hypothetical protein